MRVKSLVCLNFLNIQSVKITYAAFHLSSKAVVKVIYVRFDLTTTAESVGKEGRWDGKLILGQHLALMKNQTWYPGGDHFKLQNSPSFQCCIINPPCSLGAAVLVFTVFLWIIWRSSPSSKSSQTIRAGVAAVTHSDWVVPASGGHRLDVWGAGAAHTLPTCPAVVLRHCWSEGFGALVALGDVLVWHPVVWPSHAFHKTWREWMEQ